MAIGLRSFFQRTPKKGKPIALRGFAQGVADVDECLWNMSIAGGYIDRTNRRNWVIVPDASSPFGVNHDAANQDTATLIETLDRDSLGFLQIRGARNRNDTGYSLDTFDSDLDRIPIFDESNDQIRWGTASAVSGTTEKNHPFHYERTDTANGTVSSAVYRLGEDDPVSIIGDTTITPVTSRAYWVKVNWSSNHQSPVVTWENGTSFPAGGDTAVWIYPVLSFDAAGTCKEHRQSDINLPDFYLPEPPTHDAVLWWDNGVNKFKYTETTPDTYMVVQYVPDTSAGGNVFDVAYQGWGGVTP